MSDVFVNPTSPLQQLKAFQEKAQKGQREGSGQFAEVLKNALQEVDTLQKESNSEIQKVLAGEVKDVHSAMIAMQKADLSFQMLMQVRNKLVEAYHEVMRMQI